MTLIKKGDERLSNLESRGKDSEKRKPYFETLGFYRKSVTDSLSPNKKGDTKYKQSATYL